MISQETINEVLERSTLSEIVKETVALTQRGTSLQGLCPFHSEKTPSFHVRDERGFYHCFGCGASGNIVSFVMQVQGVSFPEAIDLLAARYSIEVRHTGRRQQVPQVDRSKFYAVTTEAQRYFIESLAKAPKDVLTYLENREISKQACKAFGVGFGPNSWHSLDKYLAHRKIEKDDSVGAGVLRRSSKGDVYDTFRGRLVFPVWISRNQIAGFGGRMIPSLFSEKDQSEIPKYLNSTESPIYQKRKILYGLPQAIDSIRETKTVYIVEGYLDVISLWQRGVRNVVAACGTALTIEHVRRLSTLARRVFVLFDADKAGKAAAGKSFDIFLNAGVDASAIFLPDGEDPDTVARKHGSESKDYLDAIERVPLIDCYVDLLLSKHVAPDSTRIGAAIKGKVAEEVVQTLKVVKNDIERSELTSRAAFLLSIDPDQFRSFFDGKVSEASKKLAEKKERQSVEPEKVIEGEIRRKQIMELPVLDRQLLHAVMANKESLPRRVLHCGDLCVVLDPDTRAFIEYLDEVMTQVDVGSSGGKESILQILKSFGESWQVHWRDAYRMAEDASTNFEQTFEDCKAKAGMFGIQREIDAIQKRMVGEKDSETLAVLARQRISLLKNRES